MQGQQDLVSYLKTNFEHRNRDQYLELIRQTISTQSQPTQIQPIIEEYASQYRNFIHNFNFTANNKANALIEEALNDVHPGLKTKKQCKTLLSIVAKIFCQELIEQCVEVKQQLNKKQLDNGQPPTVQTNGHKRDKDQNQIDVDVVEEAYRRRLIKKEGI